MRILILGVGNILFGDEGIGVHLANYLDEKYSFNSKEAVVDIVDGGTLAQRLIPIITYYDRVILIDCVQVIDGDVGDVYCFDFDDIPSFITWQGSAHEVEMLQTLEMIEMMDALPLVKVIGVIPFVIAQDTTFSITKELLEASLVMEKKIIEYLRELKINISIKNADVVLSEVAKTSYSRGLKQ